MVMLLSNADTIRRAEHLGSLLRPSKLLDKRHAVQQGKEEGTDLPQLEDDSIKDIVKIQTECGFHAISVRTLCPLETFEV